MALAGEPNKTQRPAHWANSSGTLFKNPWPESSRPPAWNELSWPVAWKKPASADARRIAVRQPDFTFDGHSQNSVRATWLGHSTALCQIPLEGHEQQCFNVLADPLFSARAGPTQYTGVLRFLPPPCAIKDLPRIDVVLITHVSALMIAQLC